MGTDQGIEARVARLEDEGAVLRALYRYCLALDGYVVADYVDCFAPDGTFEVLNEDGTSARRISGRDDLAEYVSKMGAQKGPTLKHLYTNSRISVDGDTASAAGYGVALASVNGAAELRSFGSYQDQLVRGPDGVWRIKQKIYRFEGMGPSHRRPT